MGEKIQAPRYCIYALYSTEDQQRTYKIVHELIDMRMIRESAANLSGTSIKIGADHPEILIYLDSREREFTSMGA